MSSSAVLNIDNLSLEFPAYRSNVQALNGVSLHVNPGEIVGVVGESGSGKSVTAMLSLRLLPERSYRITSGSLSLLGRDMLATPEKQLLQIRGRDAAMIFQEPMTALNPTRRIGRQMLDVIIHHQRLSQDQARAKAIALLRDMHIADPEQVLQAYPFELSGGMRQRVMIALAFSCEPQLLIADRVYVMYTGAVVEQGSTAQVMLDPQHPYTRGLLSGLPEQVAPGEPLLTIPGQVPNLAHLPAGCTFRERCPQAMAICAQRPPLHSINAGEQRKSACWLAAPESAQ